MIAAFGVSAVFLACYLWYHFQVGSVRFTHPGIVRYVYLAILASHVLLAVTVPFLAIRQMYLGFRAIGCCNGKMPQAEKMAAMDLYRQKHVRLAKWVFPIWLYVSITGVVVYVMLLSSLAARWAMTLELTVRSGAPGQLREVRYESHLSSIRARDRAVDCCRTGGCTGAFDRERRSRLPHVQRWPRSK